MSNAAISTTRAGSGPSNMRAPGEVMRLQRMGASFPTRLSFMRTLIRQLASEQACVTRTVWQLDDEGYGRAVYQVTLGGHDQAIAAFKRL